MKLQLSNDEFLTDGDREKLSKLSKDHLKRMWNKHWRRYNNICVTLEYIKNNNVTISKEDLDNIILKKKRTYWSYVEIFNMWNKAPKKKN